MISLETTPNPMPRFIVKKDEDRIGSINFNCNSWEFLSWPDSETSFKKAHLEDLIAEIEYNYETL